MQDPDAAPPSTISENDFVERLAQISGDRHAGVAALREALDSSVERLRSQAGRQLTLSALFQTATEIIDVRDTERLLRAAVLRARSLIAGDLGYLALYDEQSKGTRVTAAVGMTTSAFGSLHVPLGVGIGGKVSELRLPFSTEDYLSDNRIVHVIGVDEGIKAEGLCAMLGVPLIAHDAFLGALFVADRRVRRYSTEEIDRLQALAAVIAVALDNARLFEREQASIKQLQLAQKSLNGRLKAAEREALIHQRVASVLARNGQLHDLETIIREEFGAQARFVASRNQPVPADTAGSHTLQTEVGAQVGLSLVVAAERPLVGSERRVIERIAQAAEALALRRKLDVAERVLNGRALFHRLTSGGLTLSEAIRRGTALGIDLLEPCQVLATRSEAYTADKLELFLLETLDAVPCVIGQADEFAIALVSGRASFDLARVQSEMNRLVGAPVVIGTADCKDPVSGLMRSVSEATAHAELVTALGRAGQTPSGMPTSAEALLLRNVSPQEGHTFVEASIGALVDYDVSRRSDLVATLRTYFARNMNATRAAADLKIHAKTMAQRMSRISKLTGIDWFDGPAVLKMQIALLLYDLRAASGGRDATGRGS